MKQLLTQFVDALLPPSAEVQYLRTLTPEAVTACYRPHKHPWFTALSDYQHPTIAAAIRAHKFQHYRPAQVMLISLMETWLETTSDNLILVPMPLHPTRERERGYNQVTAVLQGCKTPHPVIPALNRIVPTKPQTTLEKAARQDNVREAFAISSYAKKITPGSQVVLVDDVLSTGATMKAARAQLSAHLPPDCTLTCLAFAH